MERSQIHVAPTRVPSNRLELPFTDAMLVRAGNSKIRRVALMTRWPSAQDLMRFCHNEVPSRRFRTWGGGSDMETIRERILHGRRTNEAMVRSIEQRAAAVTAAAGLDNVRELGPCGYVSNPAAVGAGTPFFMERRDEDESAKAPLTIWLPVTTSAGLDNETYGSVMAAMAAVCYGLAAVRPTRLMLYSDLDDGTGAHIQTVEIPTEFVDAKFLAAMADVSVGRLPFMGVTRHYCNYHGQWAFKMPTCDPQRRDMVRASLEVQEGDVFLSSATIGTPNIWSDDIIECLERSGCDFDPQEVRDLLAQ